MNFFEQQKKARQHTFYLVVLFVLAVLALIAIVLLFLMGLYASAIHIPLAVFFSDPLRYVENKTIVEIALGVVAFVAIGSLYKYLTLSSGGKNVALGLGGNQLNYNSATAQERVLLNVVEEISIAAGISVPAVYLLDEDSINAFAAGLSFDDAVIGVTRGAVEKLDRNELQGVIAHEFSHIFNGDMRLNLQLTALLHGILLIGLTGWTILRSMSRVRISSSKKGGGGAYIILFAVGLLVIGYVGTFFGSLIKANVSRKREYLADATAVQYTRYPQGIANALKKIMHYNSKLQAPAAATYSHLYFAEGVSSFFGSLMATHPPLFDRIKKIEPYWDGEIPHYPEKKSSVQKKREKELKKEVEKEKKERIIQGAMATTMMHVGQVKEEEVEQVHKEIKALDTKILDRLNDPLGAQAVILSLFYDAAYKKELFDILQKENRYLLLEFASFLSESHTELKKESALVVSLGLNALKSLSIQQYQHFKTIMEAFIGIDNEVSLFEWSLQYIIERPLEIHLGIRKVSKSSHSHLGALKQEVEVLISMLIQAQYDDETKAQEAFVKVKKAMYAGALQYCPREQITHDLFIKSIQAIEKAKPGVAERIFEGVLYSVKIDGEISVEENTFVHAVAQLMQVPLPYEFKLEKSA
jgi:Zn-dependent protease with chaperone function